MTELDPNRVRTPPPSRARTLIRFSRFETRILAALVAVAIIPLLAALLFGRAALRDAYEVGVNARVGTELDRGLELYRSHFVAVRAHAERTADALAHDYVLVGAARAHDADRVRARIDQLDETQPEAALRVVALEVLRDGVSLAQVAHPRGGAEERTLSLSRVVPPEAVGDPSLEVRIVLATPSAPFERYAEAGEVSEVYGRLEANTSSLSGFYLLAFSSVLLAVIASALALGLVVARRLTRRVAALSEAARRVGAGDLTVEVSSGSQDEVGDLVSAFNSMVKDIRSSRDRIEYLQRMAAWQEMARRLAHEIKNPLTPIQLAVQDLHERYPGDDARFAKRLKDARDIVEEEVHTLRRLVTEFSDFARLPVPELAVADLVGFTRECIRSFEPAGMMPEGAPQALVPALAFDEPGRASELVAFDAGLLRKAVDNLVRNAVQALALSPSESPGSIRVRVRSEGARVHLEVEDDGPGIARQERERVFDAYFTTKSEGTGLGLAITKKIVLEHGGSIACEAGAHGGALFRITLPRADLSRDSAKGAPLSSKGTDEPASIEPTRSDHES